MEQGRKKERIRKRRKKKKEGLQGKPQVKGVCKVLTIRKPKKPNSAKRKIAKVRLVTGKRVVAHIPGEGHTIWEYGRVLIRGGKVKDLPSVKYRVIRGVYDAEEVELRRQGRSKYGRDMEGLEEKKKRIEKIIKIRRTVFKIRRNKKKKKWKPFWYRFLKRKKVKKSHKIKKYYK